jgi:hypothetical protein
VDAAVEAEGASFSPRRLPAVAKSMGFTTRTLPTAYALQHSRSATPLF